MDCRHEQIVWKDVIDEKGMVCHCNNENLCNKDTPIVAETSTSIKTTSSFSPSTASNAMFIKIRKQFTLEDSKTTRKEVIDPILGKAELTVGVIIYLFLLRCLYSAAPPYGNSNKTLFC